MQTDSGIDTLIDLSGNIVIFDKCVLYEFKDAYQLLRDFFVDVDRVLKETEK